MRHRPSITLGFMAWAAAAFCPLAAVGSDRDGPTARSVAVPSFTHDILPILSEHCFRCHGSTVRKADLDLRSPAKMEKGGASGPAIEQRRRSKSLLYEQVSKRNHAAWESGQAERRSRSG